VLEERKDAEHLVAAQEGRPALAGIELGDPVPHDLGGASSQGG